MKTVKESAGPLKIVSSNRANMNPAPQRAGSKVLRFTHYVSVIHCDQDKKQTWHDYSGAAPRVA
jgi:hypothetical protein